MARPAGRQFLSNVARASFLFAHQLLVARIFGGAVLGLFSLATSAGQVAGMVTHLGGDYLILRGGHRRLAELEPSGAFRVTILPAALASAAASLVLVSVGAFTNLLGVDQRIAGALALVAPTVIALSGTTIVSSVLQASGRLREYAIVQTLLEPLLRLVLLGGAVMFTVSWQVPLWTYTVSILVTFFVGLRLIGPMARASVRAADWIQGFRGLTYSVPVMLSFVLQSATLFANLVVLNRLASAQEAGVYSAATRLALLALWAQMAFTAPFLPLLTKALEGDPDRLRTVYQRMVRLVIMINVPLLTTLFVGRKPLMALFGDEFIAGSTALGFMVAGQVVNTATAAIEAVLPLGGRQHLGLANNAFLLFSNIALSVVLVPRFGVSGAGFATAASIIVTNLLRTYQVHARWGITPISKGLVILVGCGLLFSLVWELALGPTFAQTSILVHLAASVVAGILVLALCVALTARQDRDILRQFVMAVGGRSESTLRKIA